MRLQSSFDTKGLGRLDRNLDALRDVGGVDRTAVLLAGAMVIVALARAKAPVKTGYMRDHIKAQVKADLVTIIAQAVYSIYVEFGTRHMAARPFFRPAFDEGYFPALRAMADELYKRIKRAIK